jgi:hypothetical protein
MEEKTGETDSQVFKRILVAIKGIEVTIKNLRREITELKSDVKDVKSETLLCRTNPETCPTARRLAEHIAHDNGRTGRTAGIMGCISGMGSLLFTLLTSLFGGK